MLMVKNKSISVCCKLNSIFIVLTNNMAGMSRGCKPRILYAFCFQMLECAYQTRVKMAAHVVRAITLTFVSAQIVLKDIPAQVGNNTAFTTLYGWSMAHAFDELKSVCLRICQIALLSCTSCPLNLTFKRKIDFTLLIRFFGNTWRSYFIQLLLENLEATLISFISRVKPNARLRDLILLHKLL